MLIDLRKEAVSGRALEERLDAVRITVNKNKIPGDTRPASETSGIRVGTPAVTARGFRRAEAEEVGRLLTLAIRDFDARKAEIVERVEPLCKALPAVRVSLAAGKWPQKTARTPSTGACGRFRAYKSLDRNS